MVSVSPCILVYYFYVKLSFVYYTCTNVHYSVERHMKNVTPSTTVQLFEAPPIGLVTFVNEEVVYTVVAAVAVAVAAATTMFDQSHENDGDNIISPFTYFFFFFFFFVKLFHRKFISISILEYCLSTKRAR